MDAWVEAAVRARQNRLAPDSAANNIGVIAASQRTVGAATVQPPPKLSPLKKPKRPKKPINALIGPVAMLGDEVILTRLGGAGLIVACFAAMLAFPFKRTMPAAFVSLIGMAGWAAVGLLF